MGRNLVLSPIDCRRGTDKYTFIKRETRRLYPVSL